MAYQFGIVGMENVTLTTFFSKEEDEPKLFAQVVSNMEPASGERHDAYLTRIMHKMDRQEPEYVRQSYHHRIASQGATEIRLFPKV